MIVLNLHMPESNFDCPFLEEDPDDNTLWCYLSSATVEKQENCHGLCQTGCPIVKNCYVIMGADLNHEGECSD